MRWFTMVAMLSLYGCGGGVPQEKYDAVVKERDALQAKVDGMDKQLRSTQERLKVDRMKKAPGRTPPPPEKVAQWLEEANITKDSKLAATIVTNLGDIECELWPNEAPLTVANFVGLAEGTRAWKDASGAEKKTPLYDGTIFHRIIKGFMIQGGDPMGNGRGGPGYKFEDEVDGPQGFDGPGILAMANSGPSTNGSQFFITDGQAKWLNGKHTIFGKCATDVAGKIAQVEVSKPGDRPVSEVKIQTIKIKRQ